MKHYTKEQLVQAMMKYNEIYIKHLKGDETTPNFGEIEVGIECATNQVEYLLGFIED